VAWLGIVGTGLPFIVAVASAPFLPLGSVIGPANERVALLLVIGIAFAVTSIPVISRIFHDLGISHTRFARLVLGVAVVEDIVLWGILAVATALAASGSLAPTEIVAPVGAAVLFFVFGLTVLPRLVCRASYPPLNAISRVAPLPYVMTILLACSALAAAFGVNLVFAAFLAGYAVGRDVALVNATRTLNGVSFALFIPLYFAIVGYQIDLMKQFSFPMMVIALLFASSVKLFSAGLGATLAGFPWRDSINLSIALNARGGPGIVLASVAFDAEIINAEAYTTLVILAVVTSQISGAWLGHVLRSGHSLLSEPSFTGTRATVGVGKRSAA
jgi:Kef-type K+ transport system membrane component KefB